MQDLLGDILIQAITTGKIQISFSGMGRTVAEIIEWECFQTIQKIKTVIDDDALDDRECFYKIEEIICALESLGSDGGNRHDFG